MARFIFLTVYFCRDRWNTDAPFFWNPTEQVNMNSSAGGSGFEPQTGET